MNTGISGARGIPVEAVKRARKDPRHSLREIPLLKMIQAYRSRIGRAVVGARRKRHDDVLPLPVVDAIHVHQDSAFFDAELCSLTNGQNGGMLCVFWTKVENNAIGLEDVLQAVSLR